MAATDSSTHLMQRPLVAAVLICVGLVMIGASLVAPSLSPGRSAWSDGQALRYQSSAATLHHLSHEIADASPGAEAEAVQQELNKAQAEYRQLRGQLDAARGLPGRIALILRLAGVALAIAGTMAALGGRHA